MKKKQKKEITRFNSFNFLYFTTEKDIQISTYRRILGQYYCERDIWAINNYLTIDHHLQASGFSIRENFFVADDRLSIIVEDLLHSFIIIN